MPLNRETDSGCSRILTDAAFRVGDEHHVVRLCWGSEGRGAGIIILCAVSSSQPPGSYTTTAAQPNCSQDQAPQFSNWASYGTTAASIAWQRGQLQGLTCGRSTTACPRRAFHAARESCATRRSTKLSLLPSVGACSVVRPPVFNPAAHKRSMHRGTTP